MRWLGLLGLLLLTATVSLLLWRLHDRKIDRRTGAALLETAGEERTRFDPASVARLPEPARRHFNYMIRPGTVLRTAAEIEMSGQLGLGDKATPDYRAMTARQVLAPPYGLVWALDAGALSGSDGATRTESWTRFWLFGVVPVVRAGGNEDHRRSAFGRVVAESAFWVPASLLPSERVHWEPLDDHRARAVVTFAGLRQAVDISVADDGRPTQVVLARWSNENPEGVFREQPFGGVLSDFMEVEGYRVPASVEAGNHFGTDDYFPFFRATVTSIRFARPGGER